MGENKSISDKGYIQNMQRPPKLNNNKTGDMILKQAKV